MANDRRVGNLLIQMRAELGGLKVDIKELETSFKTGFSNIQTSAASAFKTIGASIAGAFSVAAIIGFGRSVVNLAGQLQDLQDQTGISAQLLSGMKSTLEESGTSIEAFAKGIFTAQRNLGQINSETDQAAIAVKSLGLNLNELRNASPEEFLRLLAEAMAKPENASRRAADGAAILGKQFQQLGPVIQQIAGRFEELKAAGISPDVIKKLDEFGDSVTKLSNSLQILASIPLSGIAKLFAALTGTGTEKDALEAQLSRITPQIAKLDQDLARLAGATDPIFVRQRAVINAQREALGNQQLAIERQLKAFEKPTAAGQTDFKPSAAGKKDTSTVDFIAGLDKQADAIRVQILELTSGAEAAKNYGLELEFAAFKAKLLADNKPIPADLEQRFGAATGEISRLADQLNLTKLSLSTTADVLDKEFGDALEKSRQKTLDLSLAAKELQKAWGEMRRSEREAMGDQDLSELLTVDEDLFKEMKRQAEETGKVWDTLASGMSNAITSTLDGVIRGTQTWGEAWRNMLRNIAIGAANDFSKQFATGIASALKGIDLGGTGGGGFFSSILGAFGGLFGGGGAGAGAELSMIPGFASGGIVPGRIGAPTLAMVHGGETITPASKSGRVGGVIIHVANMDLRGAQRGVSTEVRRAIQEMGSMAVKQSVSAVRDERRSSNNFAKVFGG